MVPDENNFKTSSISSAAMNIGTTSCIFALSGYQQYKIAIQNDLKITFELQIHFDDIDCKDRCAHSVVNITEYNKMVDVLYAHLFYSIPLFWENIHSKYSALVTIDQPDGTCTHCSIAISVVRSTFASDIARTLNYKIGSDALLNQHIYKPNRYVRFMNL